MTGHVLWRIAQESARYPALDITGASSAVGGGRWNAVDVPMLYTGTTIAIACLETLVHVDGLLPLPLNRYLLRITVPSALWKKRVTFARSKVTAWDAMPAGVTSIQWGTTWANDERSLLAVVPSVLVPEEQCVLINPAHPDIAQVTVAIERKWMFDIRLRPIIAKS